MDTNSDALPTMQFVHCCNTDRFATDVYEMPWGCSICSLCIIKSVRAENRDTSPQMRSCCQSSYIPVSIVRAVAPEFADEYNNRVAQRARSCQALAAKGARLVDLMGKTRDEASKALGYDSESEFQDPRALEKWGWQLAGEYKDSWYECGLLKVAKALNFAKTNPAAVAWEHTLETSHDGISYPPTLGYYEQSFHPEDGVVIVTSVVAPRHREDWDNREVFPDPVPFPKLERWSDVAFLEWLRQVGDVSSARHLKYVFHHDVINPVTRTVAKWALGRRKARLATWPGVTFKADSDEGRALIASPNGVGTAWMLIQHKEALGLKTISEVTVFVEERFPDLCLAFKLTDLVPALPWRTTTTN